MPLHISPPASPVPSRGWRWLILVLLLQAIWLAGCGGGDDDTQQSSAQGSSNQAVTGTNTGTSTGTTSTGTTGTGTTSTGTTSTGTTSTGTTNTGTTNTGTTGTGSTVNTSATSCDTATGRVLQVGAGQTYAVPSAAAAVAQDGDVIKIAAGDYRGDVATWSANNLTICGVGGGRAVLYAPASISNGKAIWVISGNGDTIDSIDFHNATVPDQNGAGIRAENTGSLLVRNSGFFDNDEGLLSDNTSTATITIEGSEFARNGYGDGQSHNLYIGQIAKLTVRNSFFHEAKIGHNLKSRAASNDIQNSYFMDGPTGTSSYLADFPNGGAVYLRGNLLQKGPLSENHTAAIAYGEEGLPWSTNTLTMVHNTVVMNSGSNFLLVTTATQSVALTANLLAGADNPGLLTGGFTVGNVTQTSDITADAADLPGASSISQPDFWPDATLLARVQLSGVPDPSYVTDEPAPFVARTITGASRVAGALQSAP